MTKKTASLVNLYIITAFAVILIATISNSFNYKQFFINIITILSGTDESAVRQDALSAVFGIVVLSLASALIWKLILHTLSIERKFDSTVLEGLSAGEIVILMTITVFVEEIVFRHCAFSLNSLFGSNSGHKLLILSSLLFGVFHLSNFKSHNFNVLIIGHHTTLGLLLAYIYLQYGFLYAFIAHELFNLIVSFPLLAYRTYKSIAHRAN